MRSQQKLKVPYRTGNIQISSLRKNNNKHGKPSLKKKKEKKKEMLSLHRKVYTDEDQEPQLSEVQHEQKALFS